MEGCKLKTTSFKNNRRNTVSVSVNIGDTAKMTPFGKLLS